MLIPFANLYLAILFEPFSFSFSFCFHLPQKARLVYSNAVSKRMLLILLQLVGRTLELHAFLSLLDTAQCLRVACSTHQKF